MILNSDTNGVVYMDYSQRPLSVGHLYVVTNHQLSRSISWKWFSNNFLKGYLTDVLVAWSCSCDSTWIQDSSHVRFSHLIKSTGALDLIQRSNYEVEFDMQIKPLVRLDHKELWTVNMLPPRGMCGKVDQKTTFNVDQE